MDPRNKIFITGGYGFIGYHLAFLCLRQGHRVILFGHKPQDEKPFKDLQREFVDALQLMYGEIIDDQLHKIMHEEPDIAMVFHLAAMKTTSATQGHADGALLAHNYDVDIEVLDFCSQIRENREKGDVRPVRLVYVSTGEVYGAHFEDTIVPPTEDAVCGVRIDKPGYLYPVSKIAGEMMLRHGNWGFQWCIARLQNPYGPGMGVNMIIPKLLHAAIEAQEKGSATFTLAAPHDRRPYIYVDDAVMAFKVIMDLGKSGETYNVAGLEAVLIKDVAMEVAALFAEGKLVVGFSPDHQGTTRMIDTHKINNRIGWYPLVPLPTGLKKTYDWYLRHYAVEKSMRELKI